LCLSGHWVYVCTATPSSDEECDGSAAEAGDEDCF